MDPVPGRRQGRTGGRGEALRRRGWMVAARRNGRMGESRCERRQGAGRS